MIALPFRLFSVALVGVLSLLASIVAVPGDPSPQAAAVAGTSSAAPTTAVALSTSADDTAFEKEVLALINKARSTKRKCGSKTYSKAKALKWNAKLALAAETHSVDMATRNYFSHTSKSGKSAGARIKATGYKYKAMGETLSAGRNTAAAVVASWLKSPAHCRILMSKSFTQVGIGFATGSGKYVYYTTADFAKPK